MLLVVFDRRAVRPQEGRRAGRAVWTVGKLCIHAFFAIILSTQRRFLNKQPTRSPPRADGRPYLMLLDLLYGLS